MWRRPLSSTVIDPEVNGAGSGAPPAGRTWRATRRHRPLKGNPAAVTVVLADLSRPHRDLREHVERIDIMRWGHAMIRPRPGFMWGPDRQKAAAPYRGLHFAHTDLSGVALFEEAFDRGMEAAAAVAVELGLSEA